MSPERRRDGLAPAWGALGFAFYATHATSQILAGNAPAALWSCHLASLLAGAGILLARPRLVGVALGWQVLGLPLWFTAVATGMNFHATSILTHIGGPILALASLRSTGMPRGVWWRGGAAISVLWVVSRIVLPVGENVNLARTYWFGWEADVVPYPVYIVIMLALCMAVFYGMERVVARLFSTHSQ